MNKGCHVSAVTEDVVVVIEMDTSPTPTKASELGV